MKRILTFLLVLAMALTLFAGCNKASETTTGNQTTSMVPVTTAPADPWEDYACLTIAEAIAICQQIGQTQTTEKYYIRGIITDISNDTYGNMTISDGTDSLFIYGTWSADGSQRYDAMAEQPAVGDEVLLWGALMLYKDTKPEMVDAWIIDYASGSGEEAEMPEPGATLTIAEALKLPLSAGEITEGRYYITATVKSVTNIAYGAMIIEDATGSISVYNSKNADGSVDYQDMENRPYKGDTVKLFCTIQNFNGTFEIKSAWIIEVVAGENTYVETDYADMTILDARQASEGTKIRLTGVVARLTYADGMIPNGFILSDGTDSLYIYDRDAAGRVKNGNTVTLAGTKTSWILDAEQENAAKYGYTGCSQLADVYLLENDNAKSSFYGTWIRETTIQDMLNTDFSADVTGRIFKVTAQVRRTESGGVVNYYMNDLDGITGSYCYSQCGCGEFDQWLREFDGKICTVYLTALNAKSTSGGCIWRFLPIAVYDDGYDTAKADITGITVRLSGLTQFLPTYTGDPAQEVLSETGNILLGYAGVKLSYKSDNTDVVYFEQVDGKTIFHCGQPGTATVTVTATHKKASASATVQITVKEQSDATGVNVQTAIDASVGDTIQVRGIVGPSVVAPQKTGFYLIDETGVIVVLTDADTMATLQIGQEVVIEGLRDKFHNGNGSHAGQTCVTGAKVLANYYGSTDYSTASFDGAITVEAFYNLDVSVDYTTSVYTMQAYVVIEETSYYTNIYLSNAPGYDKSNPANLYIRLYCSSASQYSWLKAYAGQLITVEIAPTNYNNKTYYTGCVLSVILPDGSKEVNSLNFQ